ncbi:MAG: hypothetical protein KDB27_09185 [Planctomycetales bacterium]|nr:hypothetical protein [Planctomycetales bacterium]
MCRNRPQHIHASLQFRSFSNLLRTAACLTVLGLAFNADAQTVDFSINTDREVIQVGETVHVSVYAQDIREVPLGIFSAYMDVAFPSEILEFVPESLTFGSHFGAIPSGDTVIPGLLNEIGSLTQGTLQDPPLPSTAGLEKDLFFAFDLQGKSVGTAVVAAEPADVLPLHSITLNGLDDPIMPADVLFGQAAITVVPEPCSGLWPLIVGWHLACLSRRTL